jgi:hypothetical protein
MHLTSTWQVQWMFVLMTATLCSGQVPSERKFHVQVMQYFLGQGVLCEIDVIGRIASFSSRKQVDTKNKISMNSDPCQHFELAHEVMLWNCSNSYI